MEVEKFNLELSLLNKEECENSAFQILRKLRPYWEPASITFNYFSVGITNKIFAAIYQNEKLIFRVFGRNTNKIIDRDNEVIAWKTLAIHGFAAPLFASFKNGLVCGFLEGKSLTAEQMRDDEFRNLIATSMAKMHKSVPFEDRPVLFQKLRHFNSVFVPRFDDPAKDKFFSEHFTYPLERDIKVLEYFITRLDEPLAFCHNDLLVHNIVYDSAKKTVSFIDYEYASTNYLLFDIANHFCEYAGVEDTPDYTLCLTQCEKEIFITSYLSERYKEYSSSDVEKMMKRIPLFEAAAHLFWAVWALVQSQNSVIDFDYLKYAVARYKQHKLRLAKYSFNP